MSKKIGERLEQLDPKERLEVLIKLMPFVFPRMNAMSHSMDEAPFEHKLPIINTDYFLYREITKQRAICYSPSDGIPPRRYPPPVPAQFRAEELLVYIR